MQQDSRGRKSFYKKRWVIALLGIVGLGVAAAIVLSLINQSSNGASERFYGMIEAAAQKDKIRYAYTMSQEALSGESGIDVKSLNEYDAASGEYSSAYASEAILASVGRCVKGKEYLSAAGLPDNLEMTEDVLKGSFELSDGRFSAGACDYDKARYNGDFTDGILAVGLTADQAKSMADALRKDQPATLTDEGKTTYKGKAARKISFELGRTATGKSYQSDAFFFAFRDGTGDGVGANVPVDQIGKHFDSIFQIPPVGLRGFYLIDETTNLPLYRFIETFPDDGQGSDEFARTTIMSEYAFPDSLTMDEKTQLPEIPKL